MITRNYVYYCYFTSVYFLGITLLLVQNTFPSFHFLTLQAPKAGTVKKVNSKLGDFVEKGKVLVSFVEDE